MIHTSRQLKDLVRNMSKGDSTKAQIIIRNYVMERFLERLSVSKYRNNLIFSAGDVITPHEVSYSFRLLFEECTISILAYNLETVLAEKIETLLARGIANTRMRDFYDIYVLTNTQKHNIDDATLKAAFINTSEKRGSFSLLPDMESVKCLIDIIK